MLRVMLLWRSRFLEQLDRGTKRFGKLATIGTGFEVCGDLVLCGKLVLCRSLLIGADTTVAGRFGRERAEGKKIEYVVAVHHGRPQSSSHKESRSEPESLRAAEFASASSHLESCSSPHCTRFFAVPRLQSIVSAIS